MKITQDTVEAMLWAVAYHVANSDAFDDAMDDVVLLATQTEWDWFSNALDDITKSIPGEIDASLRERFRGELQHIASTVKEALGQLETMEIKAEEPQ